MTRPMATSAATAVKSHTSSGAATYERRPALRSASRLPRSAAALCTRGLPLRRHGGTKPLAAILGGSEHVERRAAWREQNDVAGGCQLARALDGLFHREGFDDGDLAGRPANFTCRLANCDQSFDVPRDRRAELAESDAFRATARNE